MIPRHATHELLAALRRSPVVLLAGARQTGKTTLVHALSGQGHPARYVTLDDAAVLSFAREDPASFVAGLEERVAIDEVQHAPGLFPAIKMAVDRRRRAGRFLLTGSANVLVLPRLSESLAGRMEIVTLWPLSQGEVEGMREGFVDAIFARAAPAVTPSSESRAELLGRALRGGYPDAFRRNENDRSAWYDGYLATMLVRDVRDLAEVEGLSAFPRLLKLLASRSATLLNTSEVGRTAGLPQTTVRRYLALLEAMFLVRTVPAWHANIGKRLVRAPKVVLNDTGLLAHLLGASAARLRREPQLAGPLLETFVAGELARQAAWSRVRASLFHFRTHTGTEVDLVLEARDGRVVGVEVKASASLSGQDVRGLAALRDAIGERFHRGVLLYGGAEPVSIGRRLYAMPIDALWRLGASPVGS